MFALDQELWAKISINLRVSSTIGAQGKHSNNHVNISQVLSTKPGTWFGYPLSPSNSTPPAENSPPNKSVRIPSYGSLPPPTFDQDPSSVQSIMFKPHLWVEVSSTWWNSNKTHRDLITDFPLPHSDRPGPLGLGLYLSYLLQLTAIQPIGWDIR